MSFGSRAGLALAAVLALVCLASVAVNADTDINFNFAGMIPPAPDCEECETCDECAPTCAERSPWRTETNPSIFATLTADEFRDVKQWLMNQEELNLTDFDDATLGDNYIFYIDLLPPAKADALAYLDEDGPRPGRYAHVVIYFCAWEEVQELKVGPLPTSSDTTYSRYDLATYNGEDIPFNSRIPDAVEYAAIDAAVMVPLSAQLADIMLESFGATYADCELDVCLTYTDAAPRSNEVETNTRQTWFFWIFDTPALWVQNVGLETLVWHNSTNPDDFHLLMIVYNGQRFDSAEEFIESYNNDSINKISITPDLDWATFTRRGTPRPGDDIPGAKTINPAGDKFKITGQTHIEYLGWSFDWSLAPISGVTVWDVRFLGERIVYEMGTQEIYVPYAGRNPAQAYSLYLDTAWGFGASAFPLKPAVDCPDNAVYLDIVQFYGNDEPVVHPGAVCVFERDTAIALRRHYEGLTDTYTGTPSRSLVFRHSVTDYNYDYVLDYIFHPTGTIEVAVAASGYIQGTFFTEEELNYGGVRVGPYTCGSLHEHVFAYRVDIDVLGTENTMRVTTFEPTTYDMPWFPTPITRPIPKQHYVQNETESAFFPDYNNPAIYAFTNNHQTNKWGMERSYRIASNSYNKNLWGSGPGSLGEAAAWSDYNIAVLKRKEDEPSVNNVYAQARPYDADLAWSRSINRWLSDEDNLVQEDLVAYLSIGVIHLPHAEDIPVAITTTAHAGFFIQPINYFDYDPAQNLRDTAIVSADANGVLDVYQPDPLSVTPAPDCVYDTPEIVYTAPHEAD